MGFATRRNGRVMSKLAVIAGQGELPAHVAQNAVNMGHDVVLLAINGQADADFSVFACETIQLGSMGKTLKQIKAHGCTQVVMVGKVLRPSMTALKPDATALKLLGKVITRGDDSLLRVISDFFAANGIETLSPDIFMPDRFLSSGVLAGPPPADDVMTDITLGKAVLGALGGLDVGQGVVVQTGRVIAIEAAEGTNAMLRRCAALIDPDASPAVFVKMPKTTQDRKLDVPTIGITTIKTTLDNGIGVIAVQAGAVLLADPIDAIKEICNARGATLVGLAE